MSSVRSVFRVYARQIKRYKLQFFFVVIGGVVLQATNLAAPWYMRQFFNTLALNYPDPSIVAHLVGIVIVIAAIWFVQWAATRIQDFSTMYMEAHIMEDLFGEAFRYLMGHSYNFFVSRFAGSLTHRVTKFSRAFETMFDAVMQQFWPTLLFEVGAVTILFLRNHTLGLALGLWCVAFIAFQVYVARLRQPLRAARADADSRVTGSLADAISNQATIALFSGTKHEEGIFGAVVKRWREATIRSWFGDGFIWMALGLFMLGIEVGLLYGATILWGRGLMTVGDFVLIQSYLLTTFDRLVSINREFRRFYDAYADASEMVYMLELPHEIADAPGARPLVVTNAAIEFDKVGFYFREPEQPALRDFDLRIPGGQKMALVGPSGAGKSTITRLLLRMFDVRHGRISIDGQNIAQVTQESVRNAIAYVPQEPVLFHRSLMENIRYGRRGASDEEVMEAAKRAHCHEFISSLPEGYDTFVGERGVKLSGGERQRVAIARAILKNAPILLLDEATSSLDSESESLIQDALKTLMEGKTVIVIAHRLSTIMKMDRIVVLEKGGIVADGTHHELLLGGGLYKKLWNIQAGGFLADTAEVIDLEVDEDDEQKDPPIPNPMK